MNLYMNANYISSPPTPTKQQVFIYSKFNSTALLGSLFLLLNYIHQIGVRVPAEKPNEVNSLETLRSLM